MSKKIIKPFVHWVGNKSKLSPKLLANLPENYVEYHEPFVGGGALFFRLLPENAYLSDLNPHIISAYRGVRDYLEKVVSFLKKYKENHSPEYFVKARERLRIVPCAAEEAALVIYLSRTCFHGKWNVTKKGYFSNSISWTKNLDTFSFENLKAASQALQTVAISEKSFTQINPRKDAFYYLDPPYHGTWSGYTKEGFTEEDHKKLAVKVREIDEAGGYFLLSNSNTDFIVNLYKDFNVDNSVAQANNLQKSVKKRTQREILVRNY